MLTTTRTALATVVAVLVLTGCGGDPRPQIADSSPSPTTGTSGSAEAAPPNLPADAQDANQRGAESFAAYYWSVVTYAQQTGDTALLERLSEPTCEACEGGLDWVSTVYRRKGTIEGGDYSTRRVQASELDVNGAFTVELQLSSTEQRVLGADDLNKSYEARTETAQMIVSRSKGAWVVERWEIV